MFLDKFDIFVFRHRASRRNVKSMLTIENRGAGRTSTLADIVCTLCTSRYDDVCIGLVDQVLFYLSLSLSLCAPHPFFRISMTSLLPLPQLPGHTSTHGDLSPSSTLSFSVSRVLSCFCSFSPFHPSRLRSRPLCRRKNRESGRGRYTPVPTRTILPSRPPLRGSTAHTWIGAYVRKDCEKARERERERKKKGVYEKARKRQTREKEREMF